MVLHNTSSNKYNMVCRLDSVADHLDEASWPGFSYIFCASFVAGLALWTEWLPHLSYYSCDSYKQTVA